MPAQPRKTRKNYIGIVSDRVEEQRVVESLAQHGQSMKDYLRHLMATVLNHRSDVR
jgi:hypothetical protein